MEYDNGYEYLREEVRELLNEIEELLIAHEKEGFNQEAVTSLFRLVHTVKGSCGSFGFTAISEVVHVAEHLLDLIRQGEWEGNSDFFSVLLQMCDLINETFSFEYDEEVPVEKNKAAVEAFMEELNHLHAEVHMKGAREKAPPPKAPEPKKSTKPSSYEMLLKYRGIIDQYRESISDTESGITLVETSIGSYKKSLLEQLRKGKIVRFDFSTVSVCDYAGLSFLRAIPQVVKTQGAELEILGISEVIYSAAKKENVHLKQILSPYIKTSAEPALRELSENKFRGVIILTTANFSEAQNEQVTSVFLKLREAGQLQVEFKLDEIPLLQDLQNDSVCKWEFSIVTEKPQAEIEAILAQMPSDIFWDWKDGKACSCDGEQEEVFQKWVETTRKLLELCKKSKEFKIVSLTQDLSTLESMLLQHCTTIDELSMGSIKQLYALFEKEE